MNIRINETYKLYRQQQAKLKEKKNLLHILCVKVNKSHYIHQVKGS